MPFPASNGHYKLWEKLDHHKMGPKDAITDWAKDTRENLKPYFPQVEKSLGESAAILLPKTIPNHSPDAANYCPFWFIKYLTGCDRSRSFRSGDSASNCSSLSLVEEEQGELRMRKRHQIQVFVPLEGAICLSAELCASAALLLRASLSIPVQLPGCSVSQGTPARGVTLKGTDTV